MMASSSSTRCAQVCRSRIVRAPLLGEARRGRVVEHVAQQRAASRRRPRDEVVGAGRNSAPCRPTARRPAGCRRPAPRTPDGRDAGQRRRTAAAARAPSRGAREHLGHLEVGQPAAVLDAGGGSACGIVRVAHAVHARAQPSARTGSTRNSRSSAVRSSSPQLPIQTRSPSGAARRQRPEHARVGGLVPGPGALRPARSRYRSRGRAERQHAVVVTQVVARHLVGAVTRGDACRGTAAEGAAAARRADARAPAPARSTRGRARRRRRPAPRPGRAMQVVARVQQSGRPREPVQRLLAVLGSRFCTLQPSAGS
jgi:hypothetical protein